MVTIPADPDEANRMWMWGWVTYCYIHSYHIFLGINIHKPVVLTAKKYEMFDDV